MKKKMAMAVLAGVLLVSLTGCGQSISEQAKIAKECHAVGGTTYYNEVNGDLSCDLADDH